MTYLPKPYTPEPVPGLTNKIIEHTRNVLIRKRVTRSGTDVENEDVDSLSPEELYALAPCPDLLANPPAERTMDQPWTYQEQVGRCLNEKGLNEWAKSIITHLHERKNPKRKYL